jgi:hypothetical protein
MDEAGREPDFSYVDRIIAGLEVEAELESCRAAIGNDWAFVVEYVNDEVRATLELGAMIRRLLDVAEERGHVSAQVSYWFRSNQTLRSRNFGVSDGRDARFMDIALIEPASGLLGLIEHIRQKAEARLFQDGGLLIVNPPPLGKRQIPDLP